METEKLNINFEDKFVKALSLINIMGNKTNYTMAVNVGVFGEDVIDYLIENDCLDQVMSGYGTFRAETIFAVNKKNIDEKRLDYFNRNHTRYKDIVSFLSRTYKTRGYKVETLIKYPNIFDISKLKVSKSILMKAINSNPGVEITVGDAYSDVYTFLFSNNRNAVKIYDNIHPNTILHAVQRDFLDQRGILGPSKGSDDSNFFKMAMIASHANSRHYSSGSDTFEDLFEDLNKLDDDDLYEYSKKITNLKLLIPTSWSSSRINNAILFSLGYIKKKDLSYKGERFADKLSLLGALNANEMNYIMSSSVLKDSVKRIYINNVFKTIEESADVFSLTPKSSGGWYHHSQDTNKSLDTIGIFKVINKAKEKGYLDPENEIESLELLLRLS